MDDEEKPFAAERAKTGRASCKRCKGKLESGSLRVARLVPNPFGSDGSKMKAWHHVTCLFDALSKARATTRKIESPEDDIEGWDLLADEDKAEIEKLMQEASSATPAKKPKKAPAKTESPAKRSEAVTKPKNAEDDAASTSAGKSEDKHLHRDHSFRQFRQICAQLADTPAYLEKSALLRKFFAKGSNGDGFQGDLALWIRMLLPDAKKRVYNLQSRQIVKLFSRILSTDLEEMMEDLSNGDVANTVKLFFEQSAHCQPHVRSTLTMQEVNSFLTKLAAVRTEDEQSNYFNGIVKRCTANDLMMIIRLIKHDLRINARAAHILDGLHEDAYKAYQNSRDLDAVVAQVQELQRPDGKTSGNLAIGISLMTPVLPMLAEVCKSVDQAMSRCPNGMFSEVKYDGERVQLHKRGKEFKFFSRSLKPVVPHKVKHFEEFIPKAFPHGRDLILDSEVLLIDTVTNKPLPFGTLGVHKKAAFQHAKVCLFVFDCLYYNGEVLLDRSLKERRKILRDNMTEVPYHVVFSETQEIRDKRDLEAMIARVLSEGLEGLVLKDIKSIYEPGKRHWLKVKKDYLCGGKMADTADLVPLGAWFGTGSKGGMMSVFLMCCWDPVRKLWLSVTKVHGGFDDQELQKLQTELEMDRINKDIEQVPHWLRLTKTHAPDFIAKDPTKMPVWEITGAEFTKHDAHTAGISVRFPRVTRVRDDKSYKEATNLQELRVLFENSRQGDASEYASLLSADAGPSTSKKPLQKTASSPNKKEKSPSKNVTSPVKTGSMDKFVKRKEKTDEAKKMTTDSPKKAKKRPASPAPSDVPAKRSGVVKKPFPDVFTKVHMVIPEWASSRHEQLVRYFIAYGGDLLTGRRTLSATHLLFDDAHPPRVQMAGVKWVTCHWLWDSIRQQKLQPAERYAPKISE